MFRHTTPANSNMQQLWNNVDHGYESGVSQCQLESSPEPWWGGRKRVECSRSIVASQFRVVEFHISFYLQSSSDPKCSTKCIPGVVSTMAPGFHCGQWQLLGKMPPERFNANQITPTLAIAEGRMGCTGRGWFFLRDLEKGGVNRAVLGLWFPWTEVPETSQKNDISLTQIQISINSLLM